MQERPPCCFALFTSHYGVTIDKPGTYARILFIDLSSVFNTMFILYRELPAMDVDLAMFDWILDYLRGRQQQVRVNTTMSIPPLGHPLARHRAVSSPLYALRLIYTDDHR